MIYPTETQVLVTYIVGLLLAVLFRGMVAGFREDKERDPMEVFVIILWPMVMVFFLFLYFFIGVDRMGRYLGNKLRKRDEKI